jgi:transcriptional regulator with XRE-family HTH domain
MKTAELGKRVRQLRKARDWTQIELAQKVGVDRSTIFRTEKGTVRPEHDTLQKLVLALDTTMEYLIDGLGLPPQASHRQSDETSMPVPPRIVELLASCRLGPMTLAEVRALLNAGNLDPYDFEVQLYVARALRNSDPLIRQRLNEALDRKSAAHREQHVDLATGAGKTHAAPIIRRPQERAASSPRPPRGR